MGAKKSKLSKKQIKEISDKTNCKYRCNTDLWFNRKTEPKCIFWVQRLNCGCALVPFFTMTTPLQPQNSNLDLLFGQVKKDRGTDLVEVLVEVGLRSK